VQRSKCRPTRLQRIVKRSFKQPLPMVSSSAKEIFIQGLTLEGKTFRPSDWADRLCGVMSQFRPGGPQPGSHLTYSPWCCSAPYKTADVTRSDSRAICLTS